MFYLLVTILNYLLKNSSQNKLSKLYLFFISSLYKILKSINGICELTINQNDVKLLVIL